MLVHCLYDKLVPLSELKPHPKNRNQHPIEQIERLAKILKYQGWRYPVKVSKRSGFVTAGHGRIEAAQANGWKEIPVNFQDYDSDEQEYADVQADNAVASWAELDLSGINTDIGDLGPDFDIELLGIKDFTVEVADKLDPQTDEDEIPEHVEPKTKTGDIYQLGRHRLMCGDSTSIDAVEKLMGGEKADMVFTDPPYLQDKVGGGYIGKRAIGHDLVEDDLNDFDPEGLFSVLSILDPASIYAFGSKKLILPYLSYFENSGRLWDLLAMCKKNPMPSKGNNWLPDVEWIFFSRKPGAYFDDQQNFEAYFRAREVIVKPREYGHPTEKQVAFIEPYMSISCPSNGLVLDLFGGSGTTMIACEKSGRRSRLMELAPKYCDIIVSRWEAYTGTKAELLNG